MEVGFATDLILSVQRTDGRGGRQPPPTVTVSVPEDPTTYVHGITQVTITGTIDPSQTDTGQYLQLYVSGQPLGTAKKCPTSERTCTATFSWDTSSLDGAKGVSIFGRFTTAHCSADSAPRLVNIGIDHRRPGNSHVGVSSMTLKGVDYAEVRVTDKNCVRCPGSR